MRPFLLLLCAMITSIPLSAQTDNPNQPPSKSPDKQLFELRHYQMKSATAAESLDEHVREAFIPALNRAGCQPIGYFATITDDQVGQRYLLIPYPSLQQVEAVRGIISADEAYQAAFDTYSDKSNSDAGLQRIRSELLVAFDCVPLVQVSELKRQGKERLFELRIYESASEWLGNRKVDMFNSGEVPIFLDCKIEPVFMGQAIVGDRLPNLTYMTVYADAAARDAGWKRFVEHPDWNVMKNDPKWKDTVSKIYKTDLVPVQGSQL